MSVRKRNSFTRKMETKSTEELRSIAESGDYAHGAKKAALWELEARKEDGTLELENQVRMDRMLGESRYADFVKTIKKKRKFGLFKDPSYVEALENNLSTYAKEGIILKTIEKLKWHIVYRDDSQVQVRRPNEVDEYTEQIMIGFGPQNILVKSITLGSQSMDRGANSVRVKLFFHVFQETMNELDEDELARLAEETRKDKNWENYTEPEQLPAPPAYKEERPVIFFSGTILLAIVCGAILGLGMSTFYLIFLYEMVISWVFGKGTGQLMNYTDYIGEKKTRGLIISTTLLIMITAQVAGYFEFISREPSLSYVDFFHYMRLKIEAGFVLDDMNLGSWGWLGIFIIQGAVLYFNSQLRIFTTVTSFVIKRVPDEVVEYVYFLSFKEFDEDQIREKLSEKGWKNARVQDYAFQAAYAHSDRAEGSKAN